MKLNCDGSFKHEDGSAGAGMIIRDEEGKIILSLCRQLFDCVDALEAEAKACEEGIRLALEWTDKEIALELDCSVLVAAIKGTSQDRSSIAHLVTDIRDLVNATRRFSIVKVDRTQNRASHCLANYARTEARTAVWLGSGPEVLSQEVDHDLLVSPIT